MLTACADHVRTFEFLLAGWLLHYRIMLFQRAQLAAASGDAPRSLTFWPIYSPEKIRGVCVCNIVRIAYFMHTLGKMERMPHH
jgi:hypothetical protein